MVMRLQFHPFADLFPLLEGKAFDDFVEDIRANGLREAIDIHGGMILDGRNRYRALLRLHQVRSERGRGWGVYEGVAVDDEDLQPTAEWFLHYSVAASGHPLEYVISKNFRRRHLSPSQRAFVAAKLANMRQGARTDLTQPSANLRKVEGSAYPASSRSISQAEAARWLGVSERAVTSARQILNGGVPELREAVEKGRVAVSAAADLATLPKSDQNEVLTLSAKEIAARIRAIRHARLLKNQSSRDTSDLDRFVQQPMPDTRYPVILADPESDEAPDNGDSIASLPVAQMAMPNSVLFVRASARRLRRALEVMSAWGFDYRTLCVRPREPIDPEDSVGGSHDLLLLGTRGDAVVPANRRSFLGSPFDRPSQRAVSIHEIIEDLFPNLPKLDLNARNSRSGWDKRDERLHRNGLGTEPLLSAAITVESESKDTGEKSEEQAGPSRPGSDVASSKQKCQEPPTTIDPADVENDDLLAVPDFLRRVVLTQQETELLAGVRVEDGDLGEQRLIQRLREHPEAATVADRKCLALLADRKGFGYEPFRDVGMNALSSSDETQGG